MALPLDAAALTIHGVWDKYKQWVSYDWDTNIGLAHSHTKMLINDLKVKEQQLLDLIKPGLTIDQLRTNIDKYHNGGLKKLSNHDAKIMVNLYKAQKDSQTGLTVQALADWLSGDLFTGRYKDIWKALEQDKTIENLPGRVFEKTILSFVNEEFSTGGRVQSHSRLRRFNDLKSIDAAEVLPVLAKVTQSRILDRLKIKNAGHISKPLAEAEGDNVKISVPTIDNKYIDLYAITEGKTSTKAQEMSAKDLQEAKDKLKEVLKQYLSDMTPSINTIIDYVVEGKDSNNRDKVLNFFIGNNPNDLTGILGEIQALCYLDLISDGNLENSLGNKVKWTGNEKINGQKMHADIILEDYFGIQVKNTTKNLIDEVGFQEGKLSTLLSQMIAEGYITEYDSAIIASVYSTYYFNIPYAAEYSGEGLRLYQVEYNEKFNDANLSILDYVRLADRFITSLISFFMYIGVGDAMQNDRGNLLFFLGGKYVKLASEILMAFLKAIEQLQDAQTLFKITKPERGTSTGDIENIVNFVNANDLFRTNDQGTYISGRGQRVVANINAGITNNIMLRSSFDFSQIVN